MKLYNFNGDILNKSGDGIIGRWRVSCKPGFYFDVRDHKFKPETVPPLGSPYKIPKSIIETIKERFLQIWTLHY